MSRNSVSSVLVLVLFTLGMVSFYDSHLQFAKIVKNPEPPWEFTLNLLPPVLAISLGIIIAISAYRRERHKKGALVRILFLPQNFQENDEREKEITAKATRSAYISMWIAAPILAALMLGYPYISDFVPYYPLIILMLLPLIQLITYIVSWKKNY